MNKPPIRYLVSSPYGDIPADKNKWDLPLEGDSLKTPYSMYFHSIHDFIFKNECKPFLSSISQKIGKEMNLKDINEIIIRSEKHGLLYHPASVEIILRGGSAKFGLNVAVSDEGKQWLGEECHVLKKLHAKFTLPYLPKVYHYGEFNDMFFLLEDWFEGYHEFHISRDDEGTQRLKLWDFDNGYKYLSPEQSFEIYKQASKILTLYYDLENFSQIHPWHHAGGDFVVKIEDKAIGHPNPPPSPASLHEAGRARGRADRGSPLSREGESISFADKYPPSTGGRGLGGGGINVRLTTARRYEPFIGFVDEDTLNPILALCYYLLNLTIGMRLDKLDGLGESVWVEDFCVEAIMQGFLEALRLKDELRFYFNSEDEFFNILRSFTREDIKTIFSPLIDLYKETSDFMVIRKNLDKHIEELHVTILQIFPL